MADEKKNPERPETSSNNQLPEGKDQNKAFELNIGDHDRFSPRSNPDDQITILSLSSSEEAISFNDQESDDELEAKKKRKGKKGGFFEDGFEAMFKKLFGD